MDKFVIRTKRKRESKDESFDKRRKHEEIVSQEESVPSDEKRIREELRSSGIKNEISWRKLRGENLNCDYCRFLNRSEADSLLDECEKNLTYNTGQLAKVHIYGKWLDIPRKQVAYGESGLSYTFSNNTVPARPWLPFLERIRDKISHATGYSFNFVLINRYKDGNDHMGEHRDDEKDLVAGYPIASLSLGQPRDFIFKHADSRGKNATRKIDPVKVELEHGSLLMMKHPTNIHWYHALPPRKRLTNLRINMTFRKMVTKKVNSSEPL